MRSSEDLIQAWWKGKETFKSESEMVRLGNNGEDMPSPPVLKSLGMICADAAIPWRY